MISDFKKSDINEILEISNTVIGDNFQTYDEIESYLSDSKKVFKVYRIDDKIVGFIKGEVLESDLFKSSLLVTNQLINEDLAKNKPIGYFETICVREEFRRKRIATELLSELISSLKKIENINAIYSTVWKTTEGINAKKLVENLGFFVLTEITNYWHDDSIAKNYKCPKCNLPPCKCSMLFYKADV